ncbi:MAG: DegV family protein [Ruminococcaceae bacterium]|nr:DegV family protein [Oscillospiraceae bacterium]
MTKRVVLSADSTCDLGQKYGELYRVAQIPFHVFLEGRDYLDNVDIHPSDIFDAYRQRRSLPKTGAVNVSEYINHFQPWLDRGYEVVHISLGSAVSSSYQNCCIAASMLEGVYPVDSNNLCGGTGLLVIEAARMIAQGMDARQVQEICLRLRNRIRSSFILDTLDFLAAGGRCSSILALGANLLQLKPSIELDHDTGELHTSKKYRGSYPKCVQSYIRDTLTRGGSIDTTCAILASTGADRALLDECRKTIQSCVKFDEILEVDASCTISSHCGPNTVGLFFKTDT